MGFEKVTAILFDVDGTLFSSEDIIAGAYQDAFGVFADRFPERAALAPVPDLPAILDEIGKPVVEIFRNLAPKIEEDERVMISKMVLETLLERIGRGEGEHYAGVTETLGELHRRGYAFFAASNGRRAYVEAILKKNGTRDLFTEVPAIDGVEIKNKNDLVKSVIVRHGLSGETAVLIGDRTSDRDAARAGGLPFIACRFGHATDPDEEHAGAVAFLDRIGDLLDVLPGVAGQKA